MEWDEIGEQLERDEGQGWKLFLERFFDCIDHADLAAAGELLAMAAGYPFRDPGRGRWVDYCRGILAVETYRWAEAERIYSRLLDAPLEPELQARVLNELGMVYEYLGRWQESVDTYRRSLQVFRALGDQLYVGKVSKNLGIALTRGAEAGDFDASALDEAIACHRRALERFRAAGEPRLEGRAWNELGTVYKALGRWDEALDCYQRDITLCREHGHRHGLGLALVNAGEVHQHQGRWPEAEAAYREALTLVRAFDDTYEEAGLLANLASLRREQGQLDEALATYGPAIEVIESLRASVTGHQARQDFFGTVAHVYGGQVALCLAMGRPELAFDTVERARSRALIELLADRPIRPPQHVPPAWLAEEEQLRARLEALYRSPATGEDVRRLERRLDELRRWIGLRDAEYASFRTVAPLTLEQVCSRLPPGTALVEYFTTERDIVVFVVTAGGDVQTTTLGISPRRLPQGCFDAHGRLRSLAPDGQGVLHEPWLLSRLHRSLLAPIEPWLAGSETVVLVPHGVLHYLPLHALLDGRRRVVYSPSATVLLDYCRAKPPSPHTGCLAVGHAGDALRHAESEALRVARLGGGRALVGERATRRAVYREAGRCRFVHFACRALFNATSPLSSGLVLADGLLDAQDVLRHLRLEAELVALSACDTGRSQVRAGDELIGLVRAFLYAGTPSVLVSLWAVDDLSTRVFMERFYRELLVLDDSPAPFGKAEALQRARAHLVNLTAGELRRVLADYGESETAVEEELRRLGRAAGVDGPPPDEARLFAHPYYWAPFILLGDRSPQP